MSLRARMLECVCVSVCSHSAYFEMKQFEEDFFSSVNLRNVSRVTGTTNHTTIETHTHTYKQNHDIHTNARGKGTALALLLLLLLLLPYATQSQCCTLTLTHYPALTLAHLVAAFSIMHTRLHMYVCMYVYAHVILTSAHTQTRRRVVFYILYLGFF